MQIKNLIVVFLLSILSLNSTVAAETATSKSNVPKRLMLMDFKLMGATGEAKLDAEHQARLKLANAELRAKEESRYFCESLFWASQPKQAAKT